MIEHAAGDKAVRKCLRQEPNPNFQILQAGICRKTLTNL